MKKITLLLSLLLWGWGVQAQNITRIEYFIDSDPGYGVATAVSGFTAAAQVNNLSVSIPVSSISNGMHQLYVRAKDANGKWSIVNNHLFFKDVVPPTMPNITTLEYFVDKDPGYGLGTAVAITAATAIGEKAFTIPMTSLAQGIHSLYIRAKDANGKWSVVSNHLFFNDIVPPTVPNIVTLEYFLDKDPGYGLGTSVAITAGPTVSDKAFTIPMTSLTKGMHQLYVRAKDANGKWSIVSNHLFFNDIVPPTLPNITRIEYFVDTDPGFGLGTELAVPAGTTANDKSFNIPLTSLAEGVHRLFVRAKDANGTWSIISSHLFYKDSPITPLSNIVRLEYFIDSDPGAGVATNVPITAGTAITNLSFDISVKTLTSGTHKLFLRAKNANGKWSLVAVRDFKATTSAPPNARLSFSASKQENAVELNWKTSANADSSSLEVLEVQHSIDGKDWNEIENVALSGEEVSQAYVHANPVKGSNLYRLKLMGRDGNLSYSKIFAVEFQNQNEVTVSPNPAADHVTITSALPMKGYKLMMLTGQQVRAHSQNEDTHRFDIELNSVSPGVHIVQLFRSDGEVEVRRVVIVK